MPSTIITSPHNTSCEKKFNSYEHDPNKTEMEPTKSMTCKSQKQLSITSMFAVKRDRSPGESDNNSLMKKRKLEGRRSFSSERDLAIKPNQRSDLSATLNGEKNDNDILIKAGPNSTKIKNNDDVCKANVSKDTKVTTSQLKMNHDTFNKKEIEDGVQKEINNDSIDAKDKYTVETERNLASCAEIHDEVNDIKNNNNSNDTNSMTNSSTMEQCHICGQFLNDSDILYYHGHPQDSVEEYIALTNEKLTLTAGDEGDIMERPQTNITGFSIYDQQGHLVPIDNGLVENDVRIFMSGYLKSVCTDNPDIDEDSIPVKDVGPIIEWFIHGFDGGEKNCITLSTEFGEYNLMKPSSGYNSLMNNLYEKIWLSKVVVEYLEEYHYLLPTYEDLLEVIREAIIPELGNIKMTEEMLHKHSQFVCDQVVSLESDEDDDPLITLPCMRELIKLMGIKFGKRKFKTKIDFKKVDKKQWTKATTTPLVRKTFESFFTNQLDKTNHELVLRRKRCGVCEACQLSDCGECKACRAMAKFGGHGRTKKACVRRLCPNMAVQQAEDSDAEEEDCDDIADRKEQDKIEETVPVKLTGSTNRKIVWLGEPIKADSTKIYYSEVEIDGAELSIGDFVMVESSQPSSPALVTKVVYMWKDSTNPKSGYFHGEVFYRSTDTVLGEVGDAREIFLGDRCCHGAPLSSILRKAHVERKKIPNDWFNLGGKEVEDNTLEDDGKTYFYCKYYERFTARFEELPADPICPNELRKHRFCPSCDRKTKKDALNIPKVVGKISEKSEYVPDNRTEWSLVRWQEYDYKRGCGVFLKPGTFKLKNSLNLLYSNNVPKLEKVDENIYPEYYRKSDNNLRGSNIDTGEPFCVGYIVAVVARGDGPLVVPQDIFLKVNILYRPENTTVRFPQQEDLNLVYWSEEIREVSFSSVVGPCHLLYERNIPNQQSIQQWLEKDHSRFYFKMAFDKSSGQIINVPQHATAIGRTDKGKDKGKGKGKSNKVLESNSHANTLEDKNLRPLRTLDVFAGCGGLSEGLHQAGIAECKWAIENLEAAAHAYSLNNKSCTVFNEDCNSLLKQAMSGATHSLNGLRLPMQGEVELLCGGPPCQGFSGMNRFNSREYSNFKNSLVASYLSYCDYYRPKYFILENVRNFVAFKKGMVLKLTLRALLDMGYQCTFGVLQAGNYGVPQTRRRLIILAAAPGYKLPSYPEPTHVFSRRSCSLTTTIDGKRFGTNMRWDESAPARTITIGDAMSDLPEISNGANKIEIEYGSLPESHFQRMIRSKQDNAKLRDHICKNMAPLIQARIYRIPTKPGSDWRDLPNISVTLSDGTKCKVLQYRYAMKGGRGWRGVCACAAGGACSPADKQENTLIPWCLPHTANRHNNWAGLYGRLCWEGFFSTTVTDPEPMGKQGRVLHPRQPRVVSVRECARSQAFPDTYLFAGSLQDKHRQIGNAVPPPLGAALGREIKKALLLSQET